MRVNAYIDGFNLFYGALKAKVNPRLDEAVKRTLKTEKRKLRWLNLELLIKQFVKGKDVDIRRINFYTAEVTPHYDGDKAPLRQQEYLKALSTLSNVRICKGRYDMHPKTLPLYPLQNPVKFATVLNSEEKRSDVNFASHLIYDAFTDDFDLAVLVTNDSDLLEPIRIVRNLGKKFMILCPHSAINNDFLINFDTVCLRKISSKNIKNSQFDDIIRDSDGNILAERPSRWK